MEGKSALLKFNTCLLQKYKPVLISSSIALSVREGSIFDFGSQIHGSGLC